MKKVTLITFMSALMVLFADTLNAQTMATTKLEPCKKVEQCDSKDCKYKNCDNCIDCTAKCAKAECKSECNKGECKMAKNNKKGRRGHKGYRRGHHGMKPTEEAVKNLKAFPEYVDKLERHVIYLAERKNEENFKVEIIPGKMMEVDCNQHRLMGEVKEVNLEGWGYTYYTFNTNGEAASTMMMCPDPKTEKFVSGDTQTVRYNSRLPIVIYLPKGIELKYKIWSASRPQSVKRSDITPH